MSILPKLAAHKDDTCGIVCPNMYVHKKAVWKEVCPVSVFHFVLDMVVLANRWRGG